MPAHSARATLALTRLVEFDPAFGALALWCHHEDAAPERLLMLLSAGDDGFGLFPVEYEVAPAWTDGQTVFYGWAFEDFTLSEQMAVCAHEVLHIAFRHPSRGKALAARLGPRYSHRLFNIAADALINESLSEAGYTLPEPRVKLGDLLRDVLELSILPARALADYDVESLYVALQAAVEAGGKGARALSRQGGIGVDLGPGTTARGEDGLEDVAWQQRLARAFLAGGAGRGLGQLAGRIGDVPKTRTPWEKILRRLVTRAVTFQPALSYARPSRRWLALDADTRARGLPQTAFEPGVQRSPVRTARIAVCLDVSGSIPQSVLDRFAGEIEGIARRTGAELRLILFDDGIQLSKTLGRSGLAEELRALEFKAGGGTSFVEPIAEALEADPSIIVLLTDLAGSHGPAPGKVPVVWASSDRHAPTPPFGRVVSLES